MHKAISMLDEYLFDEDVDKSEVVKGLLRARPGTERSLPFYRALEALEGRVPDDALIALRLTIAGRPPTDDLVLELRALVMEARSSIDDTRVDELRAAYQGLLAAPSP